MRFGPFRHQFTVVAMLVATASSTHAQLSAASEIAAGDRAYGTLDATGALAAYERALALDSTNYEAFYKASRSAADLERPAREDRPRWEELVRKAERYARRAVVLNPRDPEGHFHLARALGLRATVAGVRRGVRLATAVRAEALDCLTYAPSHSGCLHVLGAWNAEVMRLKGYERFLARTILGGRVFGAASWADAIRYLEAAVTAAPERIVHRLELGEVYRDRARFDDARGQFQAVLRLPATDYNDERHKAVARTNLERLDAQP
jgi:tetratricopeptide (TPR) repeat protein